MMINGKFFDTPKTKLSTILFYVMIFLFLILFIRGVYADSTGSMYTYVKPNAYAEYPSIQYPDAEIEMVGLTDPTRTSGVIPIRWSQDGQLFIQPPVAGLYARVNKILYNHVLISMPVGCNTKSLVLRNAQSATILIRYSEDKKSATCEVIEN